jgi:hypothetical protein
MALLDSFYGETPAYLSGLLGSDELRRLQEQAQGQSNLGMAAALLKAGAPSRTPTGGALAIAEGLQAGQQLYKSALNQGLQEKMAAMQVGELVRKQQEAEAVRRFLPSLIQPGAVTTTPEQLTMYGQPTQGVVRDDEGNLMPGAGFIPATRIQAPSTINREALQRLALVSPETYAKYKPEYKEVNGQLVEISPLGGITTVAGQAKEDLAGPVKQAMQVLGITKPFAEVTPQERSMIGNYIDRQESLKAPKVAVDLKDKTAVAQAQSKVLADYTGVLNNAKVGETADRYLQAVNAVKLASQGNKAADGALIYAIGKIYDPSGAVQEGDKTTIVGNRSIPETVKGLANKAFKGESLLPTERQKLLDMAQSIVESKSRNLEKIRQPYVELSKSFGGSGNLLRNPLEEAISERGTLDDILGGK